jgi:hypothetical protein
MSSKALGELIDGGTAEEDQVVAKLDLREEEPVLTTACRRSWEEKTGVKAASHFCPAAQPSTRSGCWKG